jgi:hypothetical protein
MHESARVLQGRQTADKADTLRHVGGSESDAWNTYIGSHALAAISPYIGDEEKRDKMRAIVVAGLTGIAPRDEVEGMIAAQLACHDASMDCFRNALAANKTSGLFRDYLNQAGKLSRTFTMLLDALNRHRGKGSQKITVEHVHTGGQAVVGIVEAPGGGVQPSRIEASRAAMSSGLAFDEVGEEIGILHGQGAELVEERLVGLQLLSERNAWVAGQVDRPRSKGG